MSSKYLQQAKEYYHLNKDKVKEYRMRNKERIKKYQQDYYQQKRSEQGFVRKRGVCKKKKNQKNQKKKLLPAYKMKSIEKVIKEKYKRFLELDKKFKREFVRVDTHNTRAIKREIYALPQPTPFSGFKLARDGFLLTW